MKFKIDENLPVEFADELRAIGHDAITVLEQRMGGGADEDLFSVCIDEDRILMTMDIDFADIRVYPPSISPGIIVLRIQYSLRTKIGFFAVLDALFRYWKKSR